MPVTGLLLLFAPALTAEVCTWPETSTDLALFQAVSASSEDLPATGAVDGDDTATRWASAPVDPSWLQVDLGATQSLCSVTIIWEGAIGSAYQVQTSDDGSSWLSVGSFSASGAGAISHGLEVGASGRFLRYFGTARGTGYGHSFWTLNVYAPGIAPPRPPPTPPAVPGGSPPPPQCTWPDTSTDLALYQAVLASSEDLPAVKWADRARETRLADMTDDTAALQHASSGPCRDSAVDGDDATRWASAAVDPSWLQVDLGVPRSLCSARIVWEGAFGSAYELQVSRDSGRRVASATSPEHTPLASTTSPGPTCSSVSSM